MSFLTSMANTWALIQKVHSIEATQAAQYANFSGWDVYRSQLQLVTLLDKKRGSDIAQSLFNQANQFNGIWDRWTHNAGPNRGNEWRSFDHCYRKLRCIRC
ncbi:glycoside hydrolase domain-containing protein [Pseudoalteromonas luteoviolacea]|uniref:glycoside hydrolase domain-containing protein n=1 Tax=Pseudoalteromonas luteoviolacea TaxID=43657 RepID=UPI002E10F779